MIAGLPWESWLLLTFSVGAGLGIELAFFRARWQGRRRRREEERGSGGARTEEGPGR